MKRPKKLIVCCDGTWIDSDNGELVNNGTWLSPNWEVQDPSNVTRIGRAIPCEDSHFRPQIVFYQAGVGSGPSMVEKLVGGGTGAGLSENVREAYCFLANNYTHGDLIFLTGFSRGAFTARSIAALIGSVGLLGKHAMQHFYRVFEDFEHAGVEDCKVTLMNEIPNFNIKMPSAKDSALKRRDDYLDAYLAELKRHGLTREVEIQAIGVWDTVGALGVPTTALLQRLGLPAFLTNPFTCQHPYRFADTCIGPHIKHAFQALALDERRDSFSPAVWERPYKCSTTVLKQVWFPGVHSNVGGSYDDAGLADISLAWMMSELEKAGLEFDEEYLHAQWLDNGKEYPAKAHSTHHHKHRHDGRTLSFPSKQNQDRPHHANAEGKVRSLEELAGDSDYEPHWALTRLYNSATGITVLGGTRDRTPGAYHRTDYRTGKQTETPLHDTCEFVHASVRVRMQAKGKGYDGKGVYAAKALTANGWKVEDDAGGWKWVRGEGQVLKEDELGRFEVALLKEDPEMAELVLGGAGAVRVDSVVNDEDEGDVD